MAEAGTVVVAVSSAGVAEEMVMAAETSAGRRVAAATAVVEANSVVREEMGGSAEAEVGVAMAMVAVAVGLEVGPPVKEAQAVLVEVKEAREAAGWPVVE